tara:strand:- start:3212 stop:3508 length:297 start_codon:yes stop_codon:yes gene_type:complete
MEEFKNIYQKQMKHLLPQEVKEQNYIKGEYVEIDVEDVNFQIYYDYRDELLNIENVKMEVQDDNQNNIWVDAMHFYDYFFSKEIILEIDNLIHNKIQA